MNNLGTNLPVVNDVRQLSPRYRRPVEAHVRVQVRKHRIIRSSDHRLSQLAIVRSITTQTQFDRVLYVLLQPVNDEVKIG